MKLDEVLQSKPKKKSVKPNDNQIKLLAALLAVSNMGLVHKESVKDGVVILQMSSGDEKIDLSNPEKYEQEAKSLMNAAINLIADGLSENDAVDQAKDEYKDWIKQVKRMSWETLKKNWPDYGPITAAMIKAEEAQNKLGEEK